MISISSYFASRSKQYQSGPRLGSVEELDLLRRWQQEGDLPARRILVEANMRHVVAIARRFSRYPVPIEDLVAEGSLGLVLAIDKFDPGKKVRLVTYASYWIRALMLQAVIKEWKRGKTGLAMSRSKTFFRIRRVRASNLARYGTESCGLEEMARDLEVTVESLVEMLGSMDSYDVSIDADRELDGDRRSGLHDRLADDALGPESLASRYEGIEVVQSKIRKAMCHLDERERLVASARLMQEEPRTLAALGRRLGVSRERARQIEVRARQKLGKALVREGVGRGSVAALV